MIDLTPLEVRKKKGDFRRAMRGYDPAMVDDFLDLVADRLDGLVRDNLSLSERVTRQEQQVGEYRERERALTEALVTAQEMREEMRRQSAREAELARRTAEQEVKQLRSAAEGEVAHMRSTAQQEVSQLRSAVQQETSQLKARVQQEVSELRTSLRQEREREEEALRVIRGRQQQFLTAYRAFLAEELNELNGITRAMGLSAAAGEGAQRPPQAPPAADGPGGGTTGDSMVGDSAGAALSAPGLAAGGLAVAAFNLIDAAPEPLGDSGPEAPADAAPEPPADAGPLPAESGGPGVAGGADGELVFEEYVQSAEYTLSMAFTEHDPAVLYEPEPFEPEPFEPDPIESESGVADAGAGPAWAGDDDDDDFGLSPADVDVEAAILGGGDPAGQEDPLELYDVLGGDGEDGVPGAIGLGGATWTAKSSRHREEDVERERRGDTADLEADAGLPPEPDPARPADADPLPGAGPEEGGEDVDELLRNAVAAGYSLEDLDGVDELLLDDVLDDAADEEDGDGWLPGLLKDEK
jgi:cell division initiation protein